MDIYEGLVQAGEKCTSASKFIDFFIHDILDYTLLNKKETNFSKSCVPFNIKLAIKEILEI